MNKLIAAGVGALALCSMTAFAADGSKVVVGLSNGYFGTEWRNQMVDGAKEQFEMYKAKGMAGKLIVQQAGADTNQQIQDIRNMIQQHVSVIMTNANSATALNGVFAEAHRANIPVVSFDQAVTSPYAINVTVDHYSWGKRYAEWLAKALNGKGKIVVMDGIPGHPAAEARRKAALDTFAKFPGIQIVWKGYGLWDQAKAQAVMATVLASQPEIDGVFVEDSMALGVMRAFENANRPVPTMTGETQKAFLEEWKKVLVKEPNLKIFAQVNPPDISRTALGVAVRIADGRKLKPLENHTYYYPITTFVTSADLDATLAKMKDKPNGYFLAAWLSEPQLDALFQ
ncbi:MAG TPA: ABC transporter substrate-binding protein [Xanthobacteraceae bacterium]|nr:ABC transporter substrate-binding protein [Xanthobacteraceae bacterium]